MTDAIHQSGELHRLLSAMLDGVMSMDDERRLMALIDADSAARAEYLDLLEAHAILRWENRAITTASLGLSTDAERHAAGVHHGTMTFASRGRRPLWAIAAAAAVLIGGAAVGLWRSQMTPGPTPIDGPHRAVAVLTHSRNVEWNSDPIESGGDVGVRTLSIAAGSLALDLRSGVSIALTGPSEVTLDSANRIGLRRGHVTAVVPAGAVGFTVDLPRDRRVIDLGTAFGVIAEADGSQEVWVTQGRVRIEGPGGDDATATTLEAGRAMRLSDGGFASITLDPYRHLGRPRSLVALWRFDAADRLGMNEGLAGGSLRAAGDARFAPNGRTGGAAAFDGKGDALIADRWIEGLPTGDSPYTVMAWIRPTQMGGGVVGWGAYGTPNKVTALRLSRDDDAAGVGVNGLRHFWWSNDLDGQATAAPDAALYDGWRHVAATYDGTVRRLWIDGRIVAQDTPGVPHEAAAQSFAIGLTTRTLDEHFAGLIDDVAIFSEALDAERINDAMAGRFEPTPASDE